MTEPHHSVLVADDDRDVQGLVVLCLERRGYRVLRASDGERGLAAGATAYVSKPFSPQELGSRIDSLIA